MTARRRGATDGRGDETAASHLRVAVALAAALCVTACAAKSAPPPAVVAPPPEDARRYYPLEVGWRWAYDVHRGREQILAVYAVHSRAETRVQMQAGDEMIDYDVVAEGIARGNGLGEADKRTPSTDYILRSPIRVGNRWPIADGVAAITAVGQTVTVPAGTFTNCVTVEEAREAPPRLVRTTYAPDVGPVSLDSLVQIPGSSAYESTLRARLRGVHRPGEDPLR